VRARRVVGSLLAVAIVTSVGLVTGTAPRGGAQTKPGSQPAVPGVAGLPAVPGVRPMADLPKGATPPPGPPDGVVGDRVDRASQASAKVEVLENSDPRVVSAITKAGNAPGPKITSGPGEVPAAPAADLPAGAPAAMDLVPAVSGTPVAVVAVTPPGDKGKEGDKADKAKEGDKAKDANETEKSGEIPDVVLPPPWRNRSLERRRKPSASVSMRSLRA
jgi:hypothetical protein